MIDHGTASGWDQPMDLLHAGMQLVSARNVTADQPSSRQLVTYDCTSRLALRNQRTAWEPLQCRASAVAGRSPAAGERPGGKAAIAG